MSIDSKEEVSSLLNSLEEYINTRKKGRNKKVNFTLPSGEEITSWRFSDWDYYSPTSSLPTKARGIFTTDNNKIVVRGYNKFFNVDETDMTLRKRLQEVTQGPYTLTSKENGCIIFISGLANGELIVTSKHLVALPLPEDAKFVNHAVQGQRELQKQFETNLKHQLSDLAKYLYQENLTAVCELCDDEFEEHVLAYTKEEAGLYLHGLNRNTMEFQTLEMDKVLEFATTWGFHPVDSFQVETFDEMMAFLDKQAETGEYKGKEIEGFVIRCKEKVANDELVDFFFKFKFEQPYRFYRELREVTKKYIMGDEIPEIMMDRKDFIQSIYKYLKFVAELFERQPELKEPYLQEHGIIKVRNMFLEHMNLKGIELLQNVQQNGGDEEELLNQMENLQIHDLKYVLIPVATQGCGKTTVFKTIQGVFPEWGHIQNDDLRYTGERIVDVVLKDLARSTDLMMCDKMFHSRSERKTFFTNFKKLRKTKLDSHTAVKYICLNFNVKDHDLEKLAEITISRVVARGDNHQSIKMASNPKKYNDVVRGRVKNLQPVALEYEPDDQFHLVIDLEVTEDEDSSLTNAKKVIEELHKKYPELVKSIPTDEQFAESYEKARNYIPELKPMAKEKLSKREKRMAKEAAAAAAAAANGDVPPPPKEQKKKDPLKVYQYLGANIVDIPTLVSKIDELAGEDPTWNEIKSSDRVQKELHVTLSHIADYKSPNEPRKKEIWKNLIELFEPNGNIVTPKQRTNFDFYCDIRVDKVVIGVERLVCLSVTLLKGYDCDFNELPTLESSIDHTHITIGTFSPSVKPFESNLVLNGLETAEGEHGVYKIEDGTEVRVIELKEPLILEKQRCFGNR